MIKNSDTTLRRVWAVALLQAAALGVLPVGALPVGQVSAQGRPTPPDPPEPEEYSYPASPEGTTASDGTTSTTEASAEAGLADPTEGGFDLATMFTPGGLTADQAAELATRSAPSLARAEAAVAIAEAGADRAFVGFIPRLDLSARYTRLSDVEQGGFGAGVDQATIDQANALIEGVDDPEAQLLFRGFLQQQVALGSFEFPSILNQYALRASVSYPVSDLFLTILPAHRASRSFADAERIRLESERSNVGVQAREAYYQLARARGALAVAEAAVAQTLAHRTQVDALVRAGTAARVDLLRVEAQVASAQVGVARARGGVAVAEHALRVLLHDGRAGLAIGEDLTLPVQAVTGTRDALVQQALDRRQELRALLLLVEGNESLATARAGQRWPRLAVQGNLDYANPNQRVFPQEERFDATWDVSAVLTWSPSDLFTANAEVAQASAQAEQARADIEALSDGVRLEVTQAYETHASASAQLEAATAGIAAAEESYRVRQQQLAAGAAATSEVIDAEAELSRARLQYLDAQIDVRIARARLLRAIGP